MLATRNRVYLRRINKTVISIDLSKLMMMMMMMLLFKIVR